MKNKIILICLFLFISLGIGFILISSCKKEDEIPVEIRTYKEKVEFLSSVQERFNYDLQSFTFSEVVFKIMNQLNANSEISGTGFTEDTSAIWWRTQDNELFVLLLKKYNTYIDTLDNDILKSNNSPENRSKQKSLLPHNNKALLLSPFYYEWGSIIQLNPEKNDINLYFKNKLENKDYEVLYLRNENRNQQDITLEHYKNWDNYGVVSYSGHSGVINNLFIISSGILNSEQFRKENLAGFDNNHLYLETYLKDPKIYVGLTNLFFRHNYPNKINNTFLLMSSCESQKYYILADELIPQGGNSVYWGWTKTMQPLAGAWRNTRYMIDQLLEHGKTCGETLDLMVQNNFQRHLVYEHLFSTSPVISHLEMSPNSNKDMRLVKVKFTQGFMGIERSGHVCGVCITDYSHRIELISSGLIIDYSNKTMNGSGYVIDLNIVNTSSFIANGSYEMDIKSNRMILRCDCGCDVNADGWIDDRDCLYILADNAAFIDMESSALVEIDEFGGLDIFDFTSGNIQITKTGDKSYSLKFHLKGGFDVPLEDSVNLEFSDLSLIWEN